MNLLRQLLFVTGDGIFALLLSLVGGICALLLLLWVLNCTFIYDPPKKEIAYYTHVTLSEATTVNRYAVRSFFGLDGPDFYFELTLSADDKAQLIKFFDEYKGGTSSATAMDFLPLPWRPTDKPKLIHRLYYGASDGTNVFFDLEPDGTKGWLVVENF